MLHGWFESWIWILNVSKCEVGGGESRGMQMARIPSPKSHTLNSCQACAQDNNAWSAHQYRNCLSWCPKPRHGWRYAQAVIFHYQICWYPSKASDRTEHSMLTASCNLQDLLTFFRSLSRYQSQSLRNMDVLPCLLSKLCPCHHR